MVNADFSWFVRVTVRIRLVWPTECGPNAIDVFESTVGARPVSFSGMLTGVALWVVVTFNELAGTAPTTCGLALTAIVQLE
jgi:hypothetical protein